MGKSAPHDPEICRENRYRRDQFEPETEVTSGAGWLLETASGLPMPFPLPHARSMKRKGYYSPPLWRELVTRLYHSARNLRIPMTVLNDRIVREALDRLEAMTSTHPQNERQALVA